MTRENPDVSEVHVIWERFLQNLYLATASLIDYTHDNRVQLDLPFH